MELSQVRQIEARIKQDVRHINELFTLESMLLQTKDKTLFTALMHSLRQLFLFFAQKGDLRKENHAKEKKKSRTEKDTISSSEATKQLQNWLWDRYLSFVDEMLKRVAQESDDQIQSGAFRTLMELISSEEMFGTSEQKYKFGNETFLRLIQRLVELPVWSAEFASMVKGEYVRAYYDVQYYLLKDLTHILSRDQQSTEIHTEMIVRNAFKLLKMAKIPERSEDLDSFLIKLPQASDSASDNDVINEEEDEDDIADKSAKRKFRAVDGKSEKFKHRLQSLQSHRVEFSSCWIALLRQKLPSSMYRSVLSALPDQVMPHLVNPLLLSDFLSDSYNVGGVTSLLALNSLFILMQEYNLDCPDFYSKLYILLEDPTLLSVRQRDRFFDLLDVFLSSTHLPAYLTAAFAKRLARVCLQAETGAILFIVPLVYNLVLRHKECTQLIHRTGAFDPSAAEEASRRREELSCKNQVDAAAQNLHTNSTQVELKDGNDPYCADEKDPLKSQALKSSLWELYSLKHHYNAEVAAQACWFEVKLRQHFIDLKPHVDVTYQKIFEKQIKRQANGPVHLGHEPFTKLFVDSDAFTNAFSF